MVVVRLCGNEATLALRMSHSCDLSAARRDFNVGPRAIFTSSPPVNSLVIRRRAPSRDACNARGLARRLARSRRSRGDSPQDTTTDFYVAKPGGATECLLLAGPRNGRPAGPSGADGSVPGRHRPIVGDLPMLPEGINGAGILIVIP